MLRQPPHNAALRMPALARAEGFESRGDDFVLFAVGRETLGESPGCWGHLYCAEH